MNKFRYFINVDSSEPYDSEEKLKLLSSIKIALQGICNEHPDLKITVTKEVTNEDIAEGLNILTTVKKNNMRNVKFCKYFDYAQGRYRCYNTKSNNKTCEGVCELYDE